MPELSPRSELRLRGVHPDLQKLIREAIKTSPLDFVVVEGLRTEHRQRELLKLGATKTLNSRHLTGHAVDIAPLLPGNVVSWHWPHYHELAPHIKKVAKELKIPIEWGGDWKSFKDGPHWQLPWEQYPA